jgi:glyoxylase-like metal-dependent hydrolase (beta-lactamase superfamily II)
MPDKYSQLSDHLYVYHGVINVGILVNEARALLIDFGDGAIRSILEVLGVEKVESVLFTHHHRDQASGISYLANQKTRIGIPEMERGWFAEVEKYWDGPQPRWHIYNFHPHHLMLAESIAVTDTYKEGDVIDWGGARISVLNTPGHTDGSVSYAVEVDGKLFAFCGDVIYDNGQIWELYSLQKGETTTDYHGFLGARKELKSSLLKLRKAEPDMLIPSHGNIMRKPVEAIDSLITRLGECYDRYVAISALRHYFPDMFAEFEGRESHMPIRSGKPAPDFLRHYGTTWLIISRTGEAFVMDCGNRNVIEQVRNLKSKGDICAVNGLWITHYHDDHVDGIPEFVQEFGCEIYADKSVALVVENPRAFRLPCISPVQIHVDHHTKDGESWQWNEFRMTAYHFPGQTYYHGGLLVEGRGVRMFFAGDSFTMSGIDDYCSQNRNWLGIGVGFDRCLQLMQELKPTHIFNCHVDNAFDFNPQELRFMRENLAQREVLYGHLFPWDSPNYGMDENWVMCYPYEQDAKTGQKVELRVDITNHSSEERQAACRPVFPPSWDMNVDEKSTLISAKSVGHIVFSFAIPDSAKPKRTVIPVEMAYHGRQLGQFREGILVIK